MKANALVVHSVVAVLLAGTAACGQEVEAGANGAAQSVERISPAEPTTGSIELKPFMFFDRNPGLDISDAE